jgi:predicted O-methyltransferase YrrM
MRRASALQRLRDAAGAIRQPATSDAPQLFPPGAFYSTIVNVTELLREPDHSRVWPAEVRDPAGVDVRAAAQLALLAQLAAHPLPTDGATPWSDPANDQFPAHDAALLYGMVRHLAPARMIEIGSGWSTTVTARAISDGGLATRLTCVEPYPRDFVRHIEAVHELREERVEHTPMAVFEELRAGDVVFVDSSHVVKTGSDVVHLLLEVVPRLAPGVVVHLHDIFIPEDYPQDWVRAGFGWNEQYLLQAYLSGNADAHVLAMNHWLAVRHPEAVAAAFGPVELHGSSLWFATGPAPDA